MVKTTLYLPDELQRSLRDLAARSGRSQADLIRAALDEFVRREGQPQPRSIGIIRQPGRPLAKEAKAWVQDARAQRWAAPSSVSTGETSGS